MTKRNLALKGCAAMMLVALVAPMSWSQDGPLRRAGRALDNTGKNIRGRVEGEIVRGQVTAQERDLLARVYHRIHWDNQLVGSVLQIEVQATGATILRGSVVSDAAKKRAVDLASSTVGVTSVVDQLAVAKDVQVIQSTQAQPVKVITTAPAVVVPSETKVIVPAEPKVIVPAEPKVIVPAEPKVVVPAEPKVVVPAEPKPNDQP